LLRDWLADGQSRRRTFHQLAIYPYRDVTLKIKETELKDEAKELIQKMKNSPKQSRGNRDHPVG
jgi:hypothetical protein